MHTGPEGWLLAERPMPSKPKPSTREETASLTQQEAQREEQETAKYWFCMLPLETPLKRLITLAHARWVIEQFYEDAKQECGLDDLNITPCATGAIWGEIGK